jgi:hypothetical protein
VTPHRARPPAETEADAHARGPTTNTIGRRSRCRPKSEKAPLPPGRDRQRCNDKRNRRN